MKTIRSLMTLAGLSVMLFALSATGAKAQQAPGLSTTNFAGTFTLPDDAQWGGMALPAGDYALYYGTMWTQKFVEVVGEAKGSPHGFINSRPSTAASARKSALVCVRAGGTLIVRGLDMAPLGLSVRFAMPRGTQLTARNGKHSGYTQLAEAPMLIQRIPVTLNAK